MTNNRGSSSNSLLIIMMFMLIFILLPILSLVFENYYVSIISRDIVNASYASMTSSFDSINIGSSTKNILYYENDVEDRFKEYLKYNLSLDDDMKKQNGKFTVLDLVSFKSINKGEVDIISGITMKRQTIHLEMKVEFEPLFLMSDLSQKKLVDIHLDYEVPIDN